MQRLEIRLRQMAAPSRRAATGGAWRFWRATSRREIGGSELAHEALCPSSIMGAQHAAARFSLTFRACRCLLARRLPNMAQSHVTPTLSAAPPVTCACGDTPACAGIWALHKSATELLSPPSVIRPCVQQVANRTLMSLPNRRIATSQSGFIECPFKFRHGICVAITKLSTDESQQQEPLLGAINRFSCEEIP
ncbi:hypothetical protein SAMN03159495_3764 [Pseudomonas sp. NFR16]|nr:hypothetical protein SAMN03159495_3764 [Pseudomonas sp. NFR16]